MVWSGTMDIVPDHNRTVQTAFPIASIIKPDQPGAYLVLAEDAADATPEKEFTAPSSSNDQAWGWRQDDQTIPAHWVIVTDIALTAMSAADGLHVIARSLRTAEPVSGARFVWCRRARTNSARLSRTKRDKHSLPRGCLEGAAREPHRSSPLMDPVVTLPLWTSIDPPSTSPIEALPADQTRGS